MPSNSKIFYFTKSGQCQYGMPTLIKKWVALLELQGLLKIQNNIREQQSMGPPHQDNYAFRIFPDFIINRLLLRFQPNTSNTS